MSVNSSSSSSIINHFFHCINSGAPEIFTAFIITKTFLLLPLCSLVFYLGHQRWRQQRSFATTSHSDIFTYHMAAVELINVSGGVVYICGSYTGLFAMMILGLFLFSTACPAQMLFHLLTCVDRYLAVVHPVTYLGLKQSSGVKIRNISLACVWLLCCGWTGTLHIPDLSFIIMLSTLVFALIVISFCSLRVLCVLARPGPGDVGGDSQRVDQSKQRAFHTVTAIMGVLWFWFAGFFVCLSLDVLSLLSHSDGCVALMSAVWFSVPSSLVLPLLFLHRAGRLVCCH